MTEDGPAHLCQQLLQVEASARPSAMEAIQHNCLQQVAGLSLPALPEGASAAKQREEKSRATSLRKFSAQLDLRCKAIKLAARQLSCMGELPRLADVLGALDASGCRLAHQQAFEAALCARGVATSCAAGAAAAFSKPLGAGGTDAVGGVAYVEFLREVAAQGAAELDTALWARYRSIGAGQPFPLSTTTGEDGLQGTGSVFGDAIRALAKRAAEEQVQSSSSGNGDPKELQLTYEVLRQEVLRLSASPCRDAARL